MAFVVLHVSKLKGSQGGLTSHIDREKNPKNADPEKSKDNRELCQKTGTIDEMINARIAEDYSGRRGIRKDAVKGMAIILSGSHDAMVSKSRQEVLLWAQSNYDFLAKRYGEKNMVRCTLHVDEKTPHLHAVVVPLTKDGRLSAKELFGKQELLDLQQAYGAAMASHGLTRGISGSKRKHVKTSDFYHYITKKELQAKQLLQHENKEDLVAALLRDRLPELTKKLEKQRNQKTKRRYERGF